MIYSVQKVLRLSRRCIIIQCNRFNQVQVTNGAPDDEKHNKKKDFKSTLKEYEEKIIFNSYLEHEKLELGHFKYYLKTIKRAKNHNANELKQRSLPPLPLSLQYYVAKERLLEENNEQNIEPEKVFQLPFKTTEVKYDKSDDGIEPEKSEFDRSNIDKWMTNYEHFDDSKVNNLDDSDNEDIDGYEWQKYYGTPDLTVSVSQVPCGGCGALLHCSEPAIPGYLPSEILKNRTVTELKTIECQRCHFLKEYNIALDVSVQPEEYEKLLQSIRNVKSLVLVMVDLLDFPCSIWSGIVDIIGTDRPIIIVGNKVDLIPGDSVGYLKRIRESLVTEINKTKLSEANIKYIAIISAKTGYGVEDLISAMFKSWLYKGDVFLVGTTNVGKSSLFNALLQSDYCKVQAVDIIQRATVSRWPGTTLNLLKFPINRPSGWKIYQRTRRLRSEARVMATEREIRKSQKRGQKSAETPALIGHIGRSFSMFNGDSPDDRLLEKQKMMVLGEKHEYLSHTKWFYDTPGVIHPDQILPLLSTEELLLTVPRNLIKPQTYYLYKGSTIFIGGLARIDHVDSPDPCRFTLFCSETLPITVTKTEDAAEVYDKFLGTELFAVPSGGERRLKSWPGLKESELFEFTGEGPKLCCGDVVLSSVAWVSVTAKGGTVCKVKAWTPDGRGIHRRCPSLLPYSINMKGKRLRDTPAYMVGNAFTDD